MRAKILIMVAIVISSSTSFAINDPNDEYSPMGKSYAQEKANAICPFSKNGTNLHQKDILPRGNASNEGSATNSNSVKGVH